MGKLFIFLVGWFGAIALLAFDNSGAMQICQEQHSFEYCQTQLR